MKKRLLIILVCVIFVISSALSSATAQEMDIQSGFVISINKQMTNSASVVYNNTHYIPMRKVFETMGATLTMFLSMPLILGSIYAFFDFFGLPFCHCKKNKI